MSLLSPGGVETSAFPWSIWSWAPQTATAGTSVTNTNGTLYYSSLYVPGKCMITGVQFLIAGTGGTDKVIVSIHDTGGNLLANSATAGVTVGTTATLQAIPLTVPIVLQGPNQYLIGLTMNGTTATYRTIPTYCGSGAAGSATQVFGTPASFTPATTLFTGGVGPIVSLY